MKVKEQEKLKIAEIEVIVGEVENSKQVHLSGAERISLVADLFNLGESLQQLQKRAEYVKKNLTYGKLSLDVWISADVIYTGEEINREVESRIGKRKREYMRIKNLNEDSEELLGEGLGDIQAMWSAKREQAVEKHRQRIQKRCQMLRSQFYHLPEQTKIDLWTKAVQKGLVKDGDPFAMHVLPMLVPEMMEEFEQAIKSASGCKNPGCPTNAVA